MDTLKKFLRGEDGLELVEYGVMTGLIVATLITAVGLVAVALTTRFASVSTVLGNL
jgi:Flp pilus assembly pilin Flp